MEPTTKQPKTVVNTKPFTDRDLSNLYAELNKQFGDSMVQLNASAVQELSERLNASFSTGGRYAHLSDNERKKVFTVVATYLQAKAGQGAPNIHELIYTELLKSFERLRSRSYYSRDPLFVNSYYYQHAAWYDGFFWGTWLSSSSSHSRSQNGDAFLLIVAVIVTMIAFCYLLVAIAESLERFHHNEGWLQATISLVSIGAGALAGAGAVFFMLNPATLVVVASGIVAAAITVGLTNIIQKKLITLANPDALDVEDPHRFKLTDEDIAKFKQYGRELDPTKVKLAIAALRAEIGELPSVYARMFKDSAKEKQALLKKVRDLRNGICDPDGTVCVGNLRFNLRPDPEQVAFAPSYNDEGPVEGSVVNDGQDQPQRKFAA